MYLANFDPQLTICKRIVQAFFVLSVKCSRRPDFDWRPTGRSAWMSRSVTARSTLFDHVADPSSIRSDLPPSYIVLPWRRVYPESEVVVMVRKPALGTFPESPPSRMRSIRTRRRSRTKVRRIQKQPISHGVEAHGLSSVFALVEGFGCAAFLTS